MPRTPWATPDQETFLFARLDDYKSVQKKGSYTHFWPALFEDWEKEFPTHEQVLPGHDPNNLTEGDRKILQEAIQERRNQLQTWYRWKCNKRTCTAQQTQTKLEKELFAARTRIPHKSEVYSKLCYEDKIKPVAMARCDEEDVTSSRSKLCVINEVTREMFEKELPEVKEQVTAILSNMQAKRDADAQLTTSRTTEDYSRAILECPALLGRFLSALADKTGWAYTVLMGGPDPNADGEICVASFHVGESIQGHTFGQAHPNFEKAYMEPYSEFLCHTFILNHGKGEGGGLDVSGSQVPQLLTLDNSPPSAMSASTDAPHAPRSSLSIDAPPAICRSPPTDALPATAHSSLQMVGDASVTTHTHASPVDASALHAGASPVHSSAGALSLDIPPSNLFLDPAVAPTSAVGDGSSETFDFGLFNYGSFNPAPLQPQNWPILPGLAGEFNDLFSKGGSLTAELNDGLWADSIPNFDPALYITPPVPTFDLGAFALSPQSSPCLVEPHKVPLRLESFPVPTPIPAPIPSISPINLPPLAVSRHSGRTIVPSMRAKKMNDIGSNKPISTVDTSDSNKENQPPGAMQEPPAWLIAAEAYLTTHNFGIEWTECIKVWRAFEVCLGYSNKKPMPSINLRPEEWTAWIAKGRNGSRAYDQIPHITSPLEFGMAVMKWWCAMQPSFRQSAGSPMPLPVYDDPVDSNCWETLKRGGPNGVVSVMTLLLWWGQSWQTASQWEESSETRWVACVVDVRRVLERVISGKKRGSGADGTASKKLKV